MKSQRPAAFILMIIVAAALVFMGMPPPSGLSITGQRVLGIAIITIGLWSTELLPMGVTAMLLVVLLKVSGGVNDFQEALVGFSQPVLTFLLLF